MNTEGIYDVSFTVRRTQRPALRTGMNISVRAADREDAANKAREIAKQDASVVEIVKMYAISRRRGVK